jgi:drug/metabolite transporter (DMT)-like permease
LRFPLLLSQFRFTIALQIPRPSSQYSRDIGLLLGLDFVGYYLSSLLDMIGLQFVSAGVGRLLLFMYPTIVVIISALARGKRPARKEIAALAITYLGVSLVLSNNYGGISDNFWFGAGIIMVSAVSFSLYLVGSREIVSRVGNVRFTAYANGRVHVLHYSLSSLPSLQRLSATNAGLSACCGDVSFQHRHAHLHDG